MSSPSLVLLAQNSTLDTEPEVAASHWTVPDRAWPAWMDDEIREIDEPELTLTVVEALAVPPEPVQLRL